MYIAEQYAERRTDELHRILSAHPLGILVTHSAAGFEANHLPFLLDTTQGERGVLLAHVARANPLWRDVTNETQAMVIFRGVHGYISPNWYPSKHETHRRVPTWNYEVVHAHGTLKVRDDQKFVRGVVARLTREHEATQPQPWKMADAPSDYLAEMLANIVGIEIQISRLEGKRKLNQHHEARDREGAIRGLKEYGNDALAHAMKST